MELNQTVQLFSNSFPSNTKESEARIKEESESCLVTNLRFMVTSEFLCSICKEFFIHPIKLNCEHTFCEICITDWKQVSETCPICRSNIKSQARSAGLDAFIKRMIDLYYPEIREHRKILFEERKISEYASITAYSPDDFIESLSDFETESNYSSNELDQAEELDM